MLVLATILGSPSLALASAPAASHATRAASAVPALALPASSSASPGFLPSSPPASPSFLPTRKKGIQLALLKSLLATAHGREILRRTYGIGVTSALNRTYGSHLATSAVAPRAGRGVAPAATLGAATAASPAIGLAPASVAAGASVAITGTGFGHFETVDILLDAALLRSLSTDGNGTLTTGSLTIPASTSGGPHTLVALVGPAASVPRLR